MPVAARPLDTLAGLSYPGDMTRWAPFHDLIAGVVTIGLLAGVVVFTLAGIAVPGFYSTAFGLSMGWVFRGGVQLQNELRHRNRGPIVERLKDLGYSVEDAEAIRKVVNGS